MPDLKKEKGKKSSRLVRCSLSLPLGGANGEMVKQPRKRKRKINQKKKKKTIRYPDVA